jgi:hypothetical protein
MTTFNIGSQNAASIQNVGGDMLVRGGIHAAANIHVIELRDRLAQLREEIDQLGLPAESHAVARTALAEAEAEAAAPKPRSGRIARSLRRLGDVLGDTGSVAGALTSVLTLLPLLV